MAVLNWNVRSDIQRRTRMNIYVGNLSWDTTESELQQLFEAHGKVDTVNVIKDKYTGRSRGFGFVEMPDDAEGQAAIQALDGTSLGGRDLRVNVAKPREERSRGRGQRRDRW
jgi:RNA recognition motif-containing protein